MPRTSLLLPVLAAAAALPWIAAVPPSSRRRGVPSFVPRGTALRARGGSDLPEADPAVPYFAEAAPDTGGGFSPDGGAPAAAPVPDFLEEPPPAAPVPVPVEEEASALAIAEEVLSPPADAADAAAAPPARSKSDVLERVLSAAAMLAGVGAVFGRGGTTAVTALVLAAQAAMYREASSVCLRGGGSAARKWSWFAAAQLLVVAPAVPELAAWRGLPLAGHAAASACLVAFVLGMAAEAELDADAIGSRLGEAAVYVLASLVTTFQSSYFIRTVHEYGKGWIIFPALLVIVNDSMAYVFGRHMGRVALIPRLSPKKTVEGFLGAAAYTAALSVPLARWAFGANAAAADPRHALAVAAFVSVVSPFGGFLASAVKRAHGAKDFGNSIPGHGGVVDRLDCQLVTAPFVYLYLKRFF
eukprot:CAMPEP_0194298246 /NCGR_PEP_ID=MMETSP0169-20130528/60059_1 /TAXON_ID=218684 /ORGANISM="Corethron pennatum, Strain L29A3" /LENGTH=413 /DNA_ID=CAMNT_0039048209 /DNA_START=131 /DNA_END=1372 /DNA_ORIENTATION=-